MVPMVVELRHVHAPHSLRERVLRLAPHAVAGLTAASGWLDTPKGRISVSWRVVDGRMTVEKSVPPGVTFVGL